MTNLTLESIEPLTLDVCPPLSEMYTLSPFVWKDADKDGGLWEVLIRAVPRRDDDPSAKVSCVYYGRSEDGLRFQMAKQPCLTPGPNPEDKNGCEDPTVAICDGVYYVYYSGWNQEKEQGELLVASGPAPDTLTKRGVRLPFTDEIKNPKEATVLQLADGSWRLFFEYSAEDASRIGLASAPSVDGPWTIEPSPFQARPGQWDEWHLSTGPVLIKKGENPVLFYNGATQDAKWRIGWVELDAGCTRVIARSDEPLIVPPPPQGNESDIAFSASAVEEGDQVSLYYSVADKYLCRAILRRD